MIDIDELVMQALDARTRMEGAEDERREAVASWRDGVATLYLELGATVVARRLGITRGRVGAGKANERSNSVRDPVPPEGSRRASCKFDRFGIRDKRHNEQPWPPRPNRRHALCPP